jgi:hypothetical protein
MTENLIITLISCAFTLVGSGFFTFLVTYKYVRRKAKSDADSSYLDNTQKVITIWRDLTEELRQEVQELKDRVELLQNNACFDSECPHRQCNH